MPRAGRSGKRFKMAVLQLLKRVNAGGGCELAPEQRLALLQLLKDLCALDLGDTVDWQIQIDAGIFEKCASPPRA